MPLSLQPADARSLQAAYVLKQTHRPLFQRLKNGDYKSDFLSSWKRSLDDREFQFCIETPAQFDPEHTFGIQQLKELVVLTAAQRPAQISSSEVTSNCLELNFKEPARHLLFDLSKLENSPTVRTEDPRIGLGLGPYRVTQFESRHIFLELKTKVDHHFNFVQFIDVSSLTPEELARERYDDYNYTSEDLRPSWIEKEFDRFQATPLKTIGLMIDVPNALVRAKIFNCVDIRGLREGLFEGTKSFLDVSTVLPIGMRGAKPGMLERKCIPAKRYVGMSSKKLLFPVWKVKDDSKVDRIVEALSKVTGVPIEVKHVEFSDYLKHLYHRNEVYDLIVVGVDTQRADYEPFFEPFASEGKKLINLKNQRIEEDFKNLTQAQSDQEEREIAIRLQRRILQEHIFLPLFQSKREVYYSPRLRNIMVGFDYLDIPDIETIEY